MTTFKGRRRDSLRRSIRHVNMHKIVTDHICCSSDCPSPQNPGRWRQRHFIVGSARFQPAKQTKLTYSLIVFNEDNVSPKCRWDPELWRCMRAHAAAKLAATQTKPSSWFLILNCEFQNISPRDYLSPSRLSLICSINGNSVPIKMSYPNEFNLRWNCLWQLVGERSLTMGLNKAVILTSINPVFDSNFFLIICFFSLLHKIPQDAVS